ncbi:MAG: pentapeptide repeat-containing protein [Corynebacterium sp.]|nr:pentapeptide repeat-containing protein [Corynebacterium sp.]
MRILSIAFAVSIAMISLQPIGPATAQGQSLTSNPETTTLSTTEVPQEHNYEGQDLQGADFTGQDLRGANFNGADLTNAILTDANLEGATFRGTRMQSANFTNTNLKRTDFTDAIAFKSNFEGARFIGAHLQNVFFDKANLKKAHFEDVFAQWCSFGYAELDGATIMTADFSNAFFPNTSLTYATFRDTTFIGTNFYDVDLSEVTGNFTDAYYNGGTKFAGFTDETNGEPYPGMKLRPDDEWTVFFESWAHRYPLN